MLTALTEPGYRDGMDQCNNDDAGGTGTRFYFLISRNQIPSFLIFRNQILMAEKNPQHECNNVSMGSFLQNAIQASTKAFLEIQGNKVRGEFSPDWRVDGDTWVGFGETKQKAAAALGSGPGSLELTQHQRC